MWRYPAMLVIAALVIFSTVMLIGVYWTRSCDRKTIKSAVDTARSKRDSIWKEAQNIRDMVALYMTMVVKFGPDSDEAKAFRFGTDSKLMRELHSDNDAMNAFTEQADIIDSTYRNIHSK